MTVAVAVLGILFLGIGLTILLAPGAACWSLENMITRRMMPVYSTIRLAFGIACILAGPSTRLPGFVCESRVPECHRHDLLPSFDEPVPYRQPGRM